MHQRLGLAVTEAELELLMRSGKVGLRELLLKIQMKIKSEGEDLLKKVLQKIDLNHDGKVTRSEFHKVAETVIDIFVKFRQGSGKDRQGMALKAKGLKA